MNVIADSDAVHDEERLLPQHQAALVLLGRELQNPTITELRWLDIACGKGQIINQLEYNLAGPQRSRLNYTGYDINVDHTRTAQRIARDSGLQGYAFQHGDLRDLGRLIGPDERFDFITCTNTVHELAPGAFAALFIEALLRLSPNGELFFYDMESLTEPELGALPLKAPEIDRLVNVLFEVLGDEFRVQPSVWRHRSCISWSVTIQRSHIAADNTLIAERREDITASLEGAITEILDNRLTECSGMLESFCQFGAQTAEDQQAKVSALYEYWVLCRTREARS